MSQQGEARRLAARSCRGWTLVEALVGLSIFGVLITQAVPGMRQLVAKQRQNAVASQLEAHLAMARSSSLSRGARVTVSPLANSWSGGWRIHLDENANGAWDDGEEVIAQASVADGVSVSANGPMSRYISYAPNGQPVQANGAFMAGTWRICSAGVPTAKRLIMSATGRIRREEGGDTVCGI